MSEDRFRKTYLVFEDETKKMTKKELARIAKANDEIHFLADCKKHGKAVKHLASDTKCAACSSEYSKKYQQDNREKVLGRQKKYYQENRGKIAEYHKQYHQENHERKAAYRKQWNQEHRMQYLQENHEKIAEYRKQYRKDNAAFFQVRSVLQRLDNDQQEAFSGITKAGAESLCGYSQEAFILHIESTFKDGMSWDNRQEWHIDHILPVAWFKSQGITDIKVINALSNLRAEWATDNLSKGSKFLEDDLTEEEFFDMLCEIEGKQLKG